MRATLYNMSGGRGSKPGDTSKNQAVEKVFSVRSRNGNYAVEKIKDNLDRTRFRIMHDRRYITPEIFWTENQAIEALLEHLGREHVRQLDLLAVGLMDDDQAVKYLKGI